MAAATARPVFPPFDPPSHHSSVNPPSAISTNTASSSLSNTFSDAGIVQKWESRAKESPSTANTSTMSRIRSPSASTASSSQQHSKTRHRRATSHSSVHSPSTFSHTPARSIVLPSDNSSSLDKPEASRKPRKKSSSSGVRPLLRKLTLSDTATNSLDLSRSAADQESSAGLNIYSSNLPSPNSVGDVTFPSAARRGYHARSTSATSQYSSISAGGPLRGGASGYPSSNPLFKPNAATHSYTPPIIHSSNAPSVLDSDYSSADNMAFPDSSTHSLHSMRMARHRTHSSPSTPPLRIQTSQSRLGQHQSTYYGGGSIASPASFDHQAPPTPLSQRERSSSFKIRKADPVLTADTIQAAREAFVAKEREKALKAEKEALKQAERQERKRAKSDSKSNRGGTSTPKIRNGGTSRATSYEKTATVIPLSRGVVLAGGVGNTHEEILAARSKEYSTLHGATDLPHSNPPTAPPRRHTAKGKNGSGRSAGSAWMRFVLWFKFRVMKMKRKVGGM